MFPTDRLPAEALREAEAVTAAGAGTRAGMEGGFPATRWSLVRAAAAGGGDAAGARRALGELCQAYWWPLYAYVRRRGLGREDAEDVTQGFFESVIARDSLAGTGPEQGRLRAFLLASIQHHLADRHRRESAVKRGGGRPPVVLMDAEQAERLLESEPAREESPDAGFDRHWARALLEGVLGEMAEYYERHGRAALFGVLRVYLEWNGSAPPYAQSAARLGSTEGNVRWAVHAMRRRFRQMVRRHIAETVSSEAEAREETDYLCRVLASL